MTQIETVQFSCPACSKRLTARVEQAGRLYACPGCGNPVPVPRIAIVPNAPPATSPDDHAESSSPGGFLTRPPATLPELLGIVLILWTGFTVLFSVVAFFGPIAAYVSLILFLLITMAIGQQIWRLLRARQRVLQEKDVSLLWGLVRLIAWEPTEGVLLLRNKSFHFSDDNLHDGKGGVRLIYPVLGEELVLRVPLETQTLHFADQNILTREYLNLSIRGTMKWRIGNIEKFYLLVSRELRAANETRELPKKQPLATSQTHAQTTSRLINAAIEWLRGIAEEQTRNVVSRVRSGLLIADKLAAELPEVRVADGPALPPEFGGATEGLASAIHDTIAERLKDYGIMVAEVSLQEIRMPEEVVRQCVEAAKTAYLPLMAQRQASVKKAELKAEADVLGKEAVATREVVANAPAYALRDFLTEFIAKNTPTPTAASVATIDISKVAAIEADEAKPRLPE